MAGTNVSSLLPPPPLRAAESREAGRSTPAVEPNRQGGVFQGGRAWARPSPGFQPRPSPPPPRPRPGAAASSAPRPPAASVLAARRCLAAGDCSAPAARSRRRRRCRRPALRTGSPAACLSRPRPSQGPRGGIMEADGAGEQMRPLLTRVRSGEAEARRQRQRRGGGWRGLAGAGGGLRAPPPAFVWLGGSRGATGPEPLSGRLYRGRACPPVGSQPRGAGRRLLLPRGRRRPPAPAAALPAAASGRTVCTSARWSVGSQAREKDRVPGPPPGPIARERTASPAQQTPLSQ